ncbi:hypothetical protein C8R44DRAFT_759160 [Mycena epipterygia]|nr:hypothetical protein C8R44DRAFT_759160 [Mycena epipterygia]
MESAAPKHKLGTIDCYYVKEVKQHIEEMWPKLLPICARKGILETDTRDW